jgi:hypothetical protein
VTNADVARVLERIAAMLEIEGANPFRVRAHSNAARVVGEHGEAMASLAGTPGALEALPGIGKDIAQKIRDVVATGTTPMYDDLRSRIPDEVVGFTELHGLGPKRVKTLFETLGIRDRAALEPASCATCRDSAPRWSRTCSRRSRTPASGRAACCSRTPGRWRTRSPSAWRRCAAWSASSWRARSAAGAKPWATSTCSRAAATPSTS